MFTFTSPICTLVPTKASIALTLSAYTSKSNWHSTSKNKTSNRQKPVQSDLVRLTQQHNTSFF
ncbi:hypothetical protein BpHYR1_027977 [Brachionus plicatilis]|uniref:Uncharacterized protein n=1 Tax=Brachionus plicatilis TaxID=10195 RepID=A0A3M7RK90_BRAPC|nr:hypothetical protein BpHYR1_027977 [Brachionus plicatilis]